VGVGGMGSPGITQSAGHKCKLINAAATPKTSATFPVTMMGTPSITEKNELRYKEQFLYFEKTWKDTFNAYCSNHFLNNLIVSHQK